MPVAGVWCDVSFVDFSAHVKASLGFQAFSALPRWKKTRRALHKITHFLHNFGSAPARTPVLKGFQASAVLESPLGCTFSCILVPGVSLRDAKDAAGARERLVIHPKNCGKHPRRGGMRSPSCPSLSGAPCHFCSNYSKIKGSVIANFPQSREVT